VTELLERTAEGRPVAAAKPDALPEAGSTDRLGVLGRIAEQRRADLAGELAASSRASLRRAAAAGPAPRDPTERLLRPGLHVIAEIKRRSPSAGELAPADVDVVARARAYERGGAAMISVLVEPRWFGGSLEDLRAVRAAVSVPVLAKDFVVDARQLAGLRAAGADAVLLLAALHPARRLRSLVRAARSIGLEPLVEIHAERELQRALASEARLIGLNNRDLRSLAVDPEVAARLRSQLPDDRLVVAESGVSEPATLAAWRALGFDAALIGEALMAAGDDPAAVESRVAAFVAAGRETPPALDPAAADRAPRVKICGITDVAGVDAAVRAGADAIGLNFVPGTPRRLSERAGARLATAARASAPPGRRPRIVGVIADADPDEAAALAARLDLDALQLSGDEPPADLPRYRRPVIKVLHLPAELPDDAASLERMAATIVERGRAYLAQPNAIGLMLDTADPDRRGGTGRPPDRRLAALVARELRVTLAGGLDAGSVAAALREIPAVAVDVASGVEHRPGPRARRTHRPRKDPFRVGLFVKRARAARLDLPTAPARPTPVPAGLLDPDANGRWGTERQFGGRFVPETLVAALVELEAAYRELRTDPRFWAELRDLGLHYVGRPSPLYRADRLAAAIERSAGHQPGRLRLYLKREDLDHTGAHKINNALGQALLTRRLGKTRVIAETGAGQHGVAAATACALLDLPCVVYMGAEDIRRQAPNVLRMRALGAEVRSVTSGSATLKDAINEAMRDWVTNVATTHYVLGSAVGPHPYPLIVRDLQRVIGDEAAAQLRADEGRLPDAVLACLGGGSNAIGLFSRFIGEAAVRLIGVEAAGEGLAGRHAAALSGGRPGVLHGARSYLLQDDDGQVLEAHSVSAGLDYPGIGPQLSALYAAGRMEVHAATDSEALEALRLVTRSEGILPALEPAHAVAVLPRVLEGGDGHASLPDEALVLLGLSGRGDKDLGVLGGDEG
jgi:tryptophan synthase beta chain